MNIKKRNFILIMIVVFAAGICIGALGYNGLGFIGTGHVTITQKQYRHYRYMDEKYAKTEELWQDIKSDYYKDVDDADLENGIYKGLFAGIGDIYSEYMTKEDYANWKIDTTGSFEGIGVSFSQDSSGNFVIVSVMADSPAKKAGLKSGDYIVKVNGKTYETMNDLSTAIRGKAGTSVKVTYVRGSKEKTISIKRALVSEKTVTSKVLPGNCGYIKISAFEDGTADDFKKELNKMETRNVKGLVIDLRDNGGGMVEEGTDIADMLMDKGVITYMEDKEGNKTYYRSDSRRTDLNYVLLVNGGTASTSEILTAAVKDSKNGKVVGTKTFGKGIVQETNENDDGSAYKLTVMQYFSPDGHTIHKKGITPDYIVRGTSAQLKKAEHILASEQ